MFNSRNIRQVLLFCVSLIWMASPALAQSQAQVIQQMKETIEKLEQHAEKDEREREMALGRDVYKAACMTCHGIKGDGNGPSAKFLDPKPRNFTNGIFKWRTTAYGQLPTEEDLERTIREGVSGTDMFPFGDILSRKSRIAVANYVMRFSPKFEDPKTNQPKPVLTMNPKRTFPPSEASAAKGKTLFATKGCTACHGNDADGNGPAGAALKDSWGEPVKPWDFTVGYYKSGPNDADLFRTITTGPYGTPMPGYGPMTSEEERWNLVDYVRSVSNRRSDGLVSGMMTYLFREEPSGRVYKEPAR